MFRNAEHRRTDQGKRHEAKRLDRQRIRQSRKIHVEEHPEALHKMTRGA